MRIKHTAIAAMAKQEPAAAPANRLTPDDYQEFDNIVLRVQGAADLLAARITGPMDGCMCSIEAKAPLLFLQDTAEQLRELFWRCEKPGKGGAA
jgi:hypothetical protein